MTAVTASDFSSFTSDPHCTAQLAQSKVGAFADRLLALGGKAAQFVKDVGRNLCQNAAAALIAGVLVAGALTAVAPALPVGGALVAGSFAMQAARTVIEAVVETAVDKTVSAVIPAVTPNNTAPTSRGR